MMFYIKKRTRREIALRVRFYRDFKVVNQSSVKLRKSKALLPSKVKYSG